MQPIIKISKRVNTITQNHLTSPKRIINCFDSNIEIWRGSKRYAH